MLKIFELYFENCVLLKKLKTRLKIVWKVFEIFGIKKVTSSSFPYWKDKKRSFEIFRIVLLEDLRHD